MNFNSLAYLIYLPIVVGGYYLLPHRFRWIWLLVASYFFYFSWNLIFGGLIFVTTLVSYVFSRLIGKYPNHKKLFLVLTSVICLGILGVFKYLQFAFDSAVRVLNFFGMHLNDVDFHILLPVGISFYTFQTLSYVIDVYRGEYPCEHHFGYYALFISFFPQLVAGPIEKPGDLLPQLEMEHHFNREDFYAALRFLALGYFRKCCIADVCGIYVNSIFSDLNGANSFSILLAGLLFCFQMYGDFAGYSEIAMGSARLLGIRLTQNFRQPYTSLTYGEFFHRWHYSLNRWFTQYLYIPLGGNRKGKARKILNIFIVFTLCGLWHGARWTYVLWGLYAAFFISFETLFLEKILNFLRRHHVPVESSGFLLFRRILILLIFIIAAILFRSSTLNEAFLALRILFTRFDNPAIMIQKTFEIAQLSLAGLLSLGLFLLVMHLGYEFAYGEKKPVSPSVDWNFEKALPSCLLYVCFFLCILVCYFGLVSSDSSSSFAYFQF